MINLTELETVTNLFSEIEILQKRSKLLEYILESFYKAETGEIIVPEKWKNSPQININMLPAPTPREFLKKKIEQLLTNEEWNRLNSY
jgi:hypothetical protein